LLKKKQINIRRSFFPVIIILLSSIVIFGFNDAKFKNKLIPNSLSELHLLGVNDTIVNDTIVSDTSKLRYPFNDYKNPYSKRNQNSALYLKNPSNIKTEVEYDPNTGEFSVTDKIGEMDYRSSETMSGGEYRNFSRENSISNYWAEQRQLNSGQGSSSFLDKYLNPKLNVNIKGFDRIFGSNVIDIKPQGNAELIFGVNISKIENPTLPINLQRSTTFDFDMKIQMAVTGKIGEKMKVGITYNTEATFEFENQTTVAYTGNEDEIIQSIEAGNVSLPLTGTLITGNQSLFGLKTALKFGKLNVTSIFSTQKSETSVIEVEGGAQISDFEVKIDEYETNRHFFLSQYFKDNYDNALKNLPIINSAVVITKVEVWVTNKTGNFENSRNIVGFMDLAENQQNIYRGGLFTQTPGLNAYPDNDLNNLYQQMTSTYSGIRNINQVSSTLGNMVLTNQGFATIIDYAKVENARLLSSSEYDINNKLGYISLKSSLSDDEVLAVAFEYTVAGQVYKVGEFSSGGIDAPSCLILKLLKSQAHIPNIPTWDLMMKNVYSIGSYQVNSEDFRLDIYYNDDETGTTINYIDAGNIAGKPLLKVMGLDQVNTQLDPQSDGFFDFIEKITINSSNGRIFFPVREPFGSHLYTQIANDALAEEYVFQELYDSTQSKARQIAEKNKFIIKGSYKSTSGSEIMLNAMSIPEGSVKASANGVELEEGTDYIVDYNLGRVTILNHSLLESGTPIKISMESNNMFNINRKTLLGTHLDYIFSENFSLGATILHLSEKPITNKVSIGNEPISNTIWGLDGNYTTDVPFLTKLVDKIPFIETKEMSTIEINGEFAHLIPGHSNTIGKDGNAYIDDFEGAKTTIDLKAQYAWVLASTPKGQNMFPEGDLVNDLQNGYNRAKFSWYSVSSDLLRNTAATPTHIKNDPDQQSSHLVREVYEKEIFPNKESITGYPTVISVANMAFYPEEKGPYNYSTDIDSDGRLRNPNSRWGGIMRQLQTNDFEAANIEFIEFWVMDPFIDNPNHTGGDLYFNLGYISEDILKDGRKSFENGLPTTSNVTLVDTTIWGRVPLQQSLVNAFDTDETTRQYQDVGMDGLSDSDERSFFSNYLNTISNIYGTSSKAYIDANNDPSNDNYHFFRGRDYDSQQTSILDRYKKYNGLEGNSPTAGQSEETYPTSGLSILPDVEDINVDNTLNEEESYFQYKVSFRPEDMVIGENYITDVTESSVTLKNKQVVNVKWYQFKIPINQPESKIGPISDFRSIRFMRMFMTNFDQEFVARFAKLDLVRSEWRAYDDNLAEGSETVSYPQDVEDGYDISVVSIEENGERFPVNYVLPPGITRVTDPTNTNLRQLNEQAISFKIMELNDGNARAAYKNVDLDIRQYKKLKMEVHGEALTDGVLSNNELTVFIRLGADYKQNYYEYEIPLKVTPQGRYNNDLETDREKVWPRDGRIDFELDILQLAKQHRNNAMRNPSSNVLLTTPYIEYGADNAYKITVVGSPNLSNIKTVMIGVRNPNRQNNPRADDGLAKSGVIWFNELRMSDFKQEGGWAANARVTTKLADFGTLTLSGNTSKHGFGSIEKKINERQKEDIYQYDVASNFELGKFFPAKNRVRIPLYYGVSESFRNPQYNPLDPDILLKTTLSDPEISREEKDSIRRIVIDYSKRRSFNLTNMKIEGNQERKKNKKKRFYHISNFSASLAYNEIFSRNIKTERDIQKNYSGSVAYVYNKRPKNYAPLKSIKFLKKKPFKLIRDFNFFLVPSMVSFRTDMNRKYQEILIRNITEPNSIILPTYKKDFLWNRNYDVKYDISRGLKLQFTANNRSRIDEPYGYINRDSSDYTIKRDSIVNEIMTLGRNVEYNHSISATYKVPIYKLPLLGWTSLNTMYKSTYNWQIGPIQQNDINIGNIIANSNTIQANGQLNFLKVYNKVPFLKRISDKMKSGAKEKNKRYRDVKYERNSFKLKKDINKTITHNLKTEDVKIEVTDENGKKIDGELTIVNENKIKFKAKETFKNVTAKITGKREIKENIFRIIGEGIVYATICVKNLSLSYTETNGSIMPGYLHDTKIVGMQTRNDLYAPGYQFVLGIQDENFARYATQQGWITADTLQTSPYQMTHTYNINLKSTIEPLKGLRIDINAMKTMSNNKNEYWIADPNENFYLQNRLYTGNFSMTFLGIRTAFEEYGKNYSSKTYQKFKENRLDVAWRLANERNATRQPNNENWQINNTNIDPITGDDLNDGYPNGYGPLSQEVLIPAFLSAYSGEPVSNTTLSAFPKFPLPNWRVSYDGLSEIKFIQKAIKSISLSHAYSATYNVGAFTTNSSYNWVDETNYGYSWMKDEISQLFIPREEITGVTISEQFNPLLGTDITWVNNMSSRFEYRKSRTLSLSFSNNQLIDMISNEIIIGVGYRIEELPIVIKLKKSQQKFKSDLNLRADLSIMEMITIIRKIEEDVDQITAGQKAFSLKFSADYALNERFNLRFFYDHAINTPRVSTAFKSTNIKFGFSVRFTLIP